MHNTHTHTHTHTHRGLCVRCVKEFLCFQLPSVPQKTSVPKIFIGLLKNICPVITETKLFALNLLRCSNVLPKFSWV